MKKKHSESAAEPQQQNEPKKGTRDVFLFGRLENEVALPVIRRLLKLDKADPEKPINLYINSSGGNGYNADAIIAVISSMNAKVNTICLGHALSGACEILAAGTGERSSYEFATLMFHQTLWEADGDITNLEIQAAQGQRFREAQIELLHRCTGQDKPRIRQDIERDHYMSAFEALDYGIIDRVIAQKTHSNPKRAVVSSRSIGRAFPNESSAAGDAAAGDAAAGDAAAGDAKQGDTKAAKRNKAAKRPKAVDRPKAASKPTGMKSKKTRSKGR